MPGDTGASLSRRAILYETLIARDGLVCGICGEDITEVYEQLLTWREIHIGKRVAINLDIDHITPKSTLPGKHWWKDTDNLQLAHRTCNNLKADRKVGE